MGDVSNDSIADIFNNEKYVALRKQQKDLDFIDEPCKSCDSWYVQEGVQGTGEFVEE